MMDWNWRFVEQSLPKLLAALPNNLLAAVVASLLAMLVGLAFALLERSQALGVATTSRTFAEFVRRTPVLVQLYFLFYVLPDAGVVLSPMTAGIVGLALHNSAYVSQIYRAGIANVPQGQWDAIKALNLGRWYAWHRIILPQAVPPMIPALGNYALIIFKETALLSVITVNDVMLEAQTIASEHYRYLEPMTLVGLIFLAICAPLGALLRRIEGRFNRPERGSVG
jgi:polar amino acid transport system permease protein